MAGSVTLQAALAALSSASTLGLTDTLLATQGGTNKNTSAAILQHAVGGPHYFDVKAYGAVGNGVANDTAALQAAINAAIAAGISGQPVAVYLPVGTYLTERLTITTQQILIGDGAEITTIASRSGDHLFDLHGTTIPYQLRSRDVSFYGFGTNSTGGGFNVHDLAGDPFGWQFENVDYGNFGTSFIVCNNGSSTGNLFASHLSGATQRWANGKWGLDFTSGGLCNTIRDCYIEITGTTTLTAGIFCQGGNVVFESINGCNSNSTLLHLGGYSAGGYGDFTIVGCNFEEFGGAQGSTIPGLYVDTGSGIRINGSTVFQAAPNTTNAVAIQLNGTYASQGSYGTNFIAGDTNFNLYADGSTWKNGCPIHYNGFGQLTWTDAAYHPKFQYYDDTNSFAAPIPGFQPMAAAFGYPVLCFPGARFDTFIGNCTSSAQLVLANNNQPPGMLGIYRPSGSVTLGSALMFQTALFQGLAVNAGEVGGGTSQIPSGSYGNYGIPLYNPGTPPTYQPGAKRWYDNAINFNAVIFAPAPQGLGIADGHRIGYRFTGSGTGGTITLDSSIKVPTSPTTAVFTAGACVIANGKRMSFEVQYCADNGNWYLVPGTAWKE